MNNQELWRAKLAALLHDPPEKALILGRAPHERGTVWRMLQELGLEEYAGRKGPIARADWWASAADRPQWPGDVRVDWLQDPVLIHPLTGAQIDLRREGRLLDLDLAKIQKRSLNHAKRLTDAVGNEAYHALLTWWRFGPELEEQRDDNRLGPMWGLLPADTRVPDHTIWDHLDLVSAFTGAFAADPHGEAALLALSIGPVQSFIAAARTTSDLWAGSHLLSRLSWEAMRPVAETLGPDAIVFPRLRGIPQVDLWLRDEMKLPDELFSNCAWRRERATDANPLFSAALPNRFVAVVPASKARELAGRCEKQVRAWLEQTGHEVVKRLLKAADLDDKDESAPAYAQMREQLEGFPEVHCAAVPFSLVRASPDGKRAEKDQAELARAMAPFFGVDEGQACGFLASRAWRVLAGPIAWSGDIRFFDPNPGVLYPALSDLAERVLAAAKAARPFTKAEHKGWRDSLTGDAEWLRERNETEAGEPMWNVPPGKRRGEHPAVETLWTRIARNRRAWAKSGEHLSALSAIKRVWPDIFAEEVAAALGSHGEKAPRFVVSTHTMALAHQLDRWLAKGADKASGFEKAVERHKPDRIALPRRLLARHGGRPDALRDARHLAGLLDRAQAMQEEDQERVASDLRRLVRDSLRRTLQNERLEIEAYYGLLLMDGDRMGAILSGEFDDDDTDRKNAPPVITYLESFHPKVQAAFKGRAQANPALREYGEQLRAPSPGRHLAVSGALNEFALFLAPYIVEEEHLGKLIYAGGDDVLAMLPVADLLPAAALLRDAYSGRGDDDLETEVRERRDPRLMLGKGFALLRGRLMRIMGERATASAGLVVAHHQTPLSRVLREARAAESQAKDAGRDRCAIRVLKRSGGALRLLVRWEEVPLLARARNLLAAEGVSRRAVYHTRSWLRELPPPREDAAMLEALLGYQLARQCREDALKQEARGLAAALAPLAVGRERASADGREWLDAFLSVAEFLARETRTVASDAAPQS